MRTRSRRWSTKVACSRRSASRRCACRLSSLLLERSCLLLSPLLSPPSLSLTGQRDTPPLLLSSPHRDCGRQRLLRLPPLSSPLSNPPPLALPLSLAERRGAAPNGQTSGEQPPLSSSHLPISPSLGLLSLLSPSIGVVTRAGGHRLLPIKVGQRFQVYRRKGRAGGASFASLSFSPLL